MNITLKQLETLKGEISNYVNNIELEISNTVLEVKLEQSNQKMKTFSIERNGTIYDIKEFDI